MKTLLIAWQSLRGAPVRSALVVLTLTLGMVGFVAVLNATAVMHDAVTQKAILTGGDRSTIQVSVAGIESIEQLDTTLRQLRVRTASVAAAATFEDSDVVMWAGGSRVDDVVTTFTTASLRDVKPFPITSGEWVSRVDSLALRVVVNQAAATELVDRAHISVAKGQGQPITAVIVGIVRDGIDLPHAYVEAADYLRLDAAFPTVNISLTGPTLTRDDVAAAASGLANLGARFAPGDAVKTDRIDGLASEIATTAQVLFVLGALSLAATVVGILNIGLSAARVRSREFALRRTMGASRSNIAGIVMVESQILAIVASAVAFLASFLLFPLVVGSFGDRLGVETPPFQPWYGLVCLGVAVVTAGVSALVPAILSYRRDLSEVMRS